MGTGRRRIAGLRVVMSWPDSDFAPRSVLPCNFRIRVAGIAGVLLLAGGAVTMGVATLAQQHAPQPTAGAAGLIGPATAKGPSLRRSLPVAVDIPAIRVHSKLLHLGVNADGSIKVPPLATSASLAAWYKYSATPGQIGSSVIEGHVDS